jgi:hypothetical protein
MVESQSQYDPGFSAFGGGASSSVLHPIVLAGLIVVAVLTFLLPRKYVIVPLFLGILLTPAGQNLYIGVHLYVYRILILLGWARLLSSKPSSGRFLPGGFITLDKVFLVWAVYRALAVVLLFGQFGAVINQAAFLLDSLGGYFLFRALIRDDQTVQRAVRVFAVVAAVSAVVMLIELRTGRNILGSLGGIRLISDLRNGRIRAQGVFEHSILAGSFGATVLPLFLWLWKREKEMVVATVGAFSASIMVFACASSTPIAAWLGGIGAACLWPIRKNMRAVRWGIVFALIGLQLVMKAPVWYVLAHIDLAGGSSGWNRANLIDTFIRHVRDWWMIGTHDNVNWGWDMWDQCNQFVTEGETGGLVALGCFITMIVICFKKIGKARKAVGGNPRKEWLFWLLGASMFAQVTAFMGVDYFDQSIFAWYALLAIISVATMLPRRGSVAKEPIAASFSAPGSGVAAPDTADVMTFERSTTATASSRWFV